MRMKYAFQQMLLVLLLENNLLQMEVMFLKYHEDAKCYQYIFVHDMFYDVNHRILQPFVRFTSLKIQNYLNKYEFQYSINTFSCLYLLEKSVFVVQMNLLNKRASIHLHYIEFEEYRLTGEFIYINTLGMYIDIKY